MKFVQLPKIWHHLEPNEFKLFTVLYDEWSLMKNEDCWFFRSQKNLCEDCGLSRNTLKKSLSKLIEKGIIMTTTYNNGVDIAMYNKANEYKINMDRVIELSEKGSKIDTFNMESDVKGVKISPKKGSKIDTEGVKISPPSKEIIYNTKETNTKVNVTYESLQDETTEDKIKEKINKKESESSSDDTLDNNKINLEEDMISKIPDGQVNALHSYIDNHISSLSTSDVCAEVETNLNNYFKRLYDQYDNAVVAQLESDVKEHMKKNLKFNLSRA